MVNRVTTPAPTFRFESVHQAASDLRDAATRAKAAPLHLLPFNRYAPENTFWWLSPINQNPAYPHGKIILGAAELADPLDLFVGFAIEKGVGPSASELFAETAKGQRWLLDRTWLWSSAFMPSLRSGTFTEVATAAERVAGMPLTVAIDAAVTTPPRGWDDEPDAHGQGPERDVVRFQYADGRLETLDADLPAGHLQQAADARDLPALAQTLEAIPQIDWVWIDFHIGVRLERATNAEASWTPDNVWRRACEPWRTWLR